MKRREDAKWSKASLRIFGDTLEPSEITASLGIAPTKSGRKGEPSFSPLRRPLRRSAWILDSPLADELPLQDHLRWLLDVFEPKLDELTKIMEASEADFFCGFSSENGQGGPIFDAQLLSRLGKLGVELILDLYPPGPIEQEPD